MTPTHTEIANAKINLNLRVIRKREDGFHEMSTRMAPISLADTLHFYPAERYTLTCDAPADLAVPLDETNLISKAVRLFERETGQPCHWKIDLKKVTPHGAGLGGGSADAAAAMRALNYLEQTKLSNTRMAELLAEIGSDIPFFAYQSVADCEGRGERVTPIDFPHSNIHLLLIKPSFGVDTPEAYKAWQSSKPLPEINYEPQALPWGTIFNDLEKPVFMKHRFLAELKMWLIDQPETEAAMMSGSGSTFMAFLKNPMDAPILLNRVKQELDPTLWGQLVKLKTS